MAIRTPPHVSLSHKGTGGHFVGPDMHFIDCSFFHFRCAVLSCNRGRIGQKGPTRFKHGATSSRMAILPVSIAVSTTRPTLEHVSSSTFSGPWSAVAQGVSRIQRHPLFGTQCRPVGGPAGFEPHRHRTATCQHICGCACPTTYISEPRPKAQVI